MRLIFFGDSFTFGQGFPDCKPKSWEDVKEPSQLGWVPQVARALNCMYVNMGYPGASNQEIFYKIRTFNLQPDDMIIVQWSYPDRDAIIDGDEITRIGYWKKDQISYRYYRTHSDYDVVRRSSMIIEHAALWLQYHDIPHIMFANNPYDNEVQALFTDCEMSHCVDSLPCGHPGYETNRAWAEKVVEYIKGHPRGTRRSIPRVAR